MQDPPPCKWWHLLAVFGLALVVFLANGRPIPSDDALSTRLVALSLVHQGDLTLDEVSGEHYSIVTGKKGVRVSRYPVLSALLAVPVFGVARGLGVPLGNPAAPWSLAALLAKLTAALLVAGSVALVFRAAHYRFGTGGAWLAALAYAFGTSAWFASQDLLQHPAALFFLAWAMVGLVKADRRSLWGVGAALALACSARPPVALIAVCLSLHVLRTHGWRATLCRLGLPALLVFLPGAAYRMWAFGHPLTTGYGTEALHGWTAPLVEGLAGLLISPSKGMLVLSPIVVLAAWGAFKASREPGGCLPRFSGVAALVFLLVMARWHIWYGGYSYGSRMSLEVLPLLCPFLPAALAGAGRRLRYTGYGLLLAFSISIQLIGVLGMDYSWHRRFDAGSERTDWLWSVAEAQPLWYLRRDRWWLGKPVPSRGEVVPIRFRVGEHPAP